MTKTITINIDLPPPPDPDLWAAACRKVCGFPSIAQRMRFDLALDRWAASGSPAGGEPFRDVEKERNRVMGAML